MKSGKCKGFFGEYLTFIFGKFKNIRLLQSYKQNLETYSYMEILSEPANLSQKPVTVNQDSDERKEPRAKPQMPTKKKIIRKKNKSKTMHPETAQNNESAEIKTSNNMAPFGIFESQTQKCQRLEHYMRKDIDNFYKTEINFQDQQLLDSLLNSNLIQLSDVYHRSLNEVWKEKICSLSQIRSYLQIVKLIRNQNVRYSLLCDQSTKKFFLCISHTDQAYSIHEISQFESKLLQKREEFIKMLNHSKQKFEKKGAFSQEQNQNNLSLSQLSTQIAFLFKTIYDMTKTLKTYIGEIKENIKRVSINQPILQSHTVSESRYISCLIKKLIVLALDDTQIDYLNFFKNNQSIQHNYGPPQATITDQKQFEQFMRKKKNKKGKKGKYVLHSACLGCCSYHYQQYNPFSYCQECYIRFHRSCYTGFPVRDQITYINSREQKDVLCQPCFNKRNNNVKHRGNQCDFCGLKGLISIPAGQFKKIHLFCMLLNGLWTVNNCKLQFRSKTQNKVPFSDTLKCIYCSSGAGYLHFCSFCEKYVHVSCAFFNGWKIEAEFNENSQNVQIKLNCCNGVLLSSNQNRRKFITNYKKQAYSSDKLFYAMS